MNSLARSLAPRITVLCLGAALASCGEQHPLSAPPVARPQFEISDGTHAPGNPGFFFLPPIAQQQTWTGVFDDTLAPVVTICALQEGTCGTTIATFTRAAPPSRGADASDRCDDGDATVRGDLLNPDGRLDRACENDDARLRRDGERWATVRVNRKAERYVVRWYTHRYHLDPAVTYRITVAVGALPLGYADVDVVRNRRAAAAVDTSRYVPLLLDRTLPIKFRIEVGALGTFFCEDGSPGAIGDLQQAINATPAGGTVRVCPGTHSVSNVGITKPLTIEGIGSPRPILDAGGVSFILGIFGPVGGPVRIRGLQFANGKWMEVLVQSTSDSVVIEGCDFFPGTEFYAGVKTQQAVSVLIQNNTFTGGDIGVSPHQGSSGVTIRNNSFTNVGTAIHAGDQSSVRIEHNAISGCGPNMCIGTFDADAPGGTMQILGNTIQVDFASATGNAIQLSVGTYQIDDNVITGIGGTRDPNDNETWPMRYQAIAVGGRATLSGNRISGAGTGLHFGETVTVASGSDNTISSVGSVLNVYQSASVTLHRNDFTDYGNAIQYINTPGTVSLTCNWWGSDAGPQNVSQWATLFTPWAMEPIANQPAVACTP